MKKNMVKTLSAVFVLTAISKVLGFLRDVIFANIYGLEAEATAYQAALKIPTQIVDIVLSSAIVSCFIPIFNDVSKKKGKEDANRFANNFINVVSIIATFIAIIGMLFAPQIVNLFTDFSPSTYSLTVELVRITFPMIIFTAMAFSFVGFLQSYGEFNIPAGISGISNLVVILFLLIFSNTTGIHGVCYCVVLAWLLQVLVQLPFAKKFGYKFSLKTNFKDENLKRVLKLAIPILISTAVLPINNLVSMKFASGIGDKYYSALEYAYKLYVVIYGIFSYAIGNIIFPELSRAVSNNDNKSYNQTINKSLKLISFLLIPLTVGLIIFSEKIVSVSYERGAFTHESTLLTSGALIFYAIGIIGAGLVEIMNKAFYAKQNTKTPLFVGIFAIVLNFILCYLLSKTSLSYTGIALATALVAIANGVVLSFLIHKENQVFTKELFKYFGKIVFSTIIMGIFVYSMIDIADYLFRNVEPSFIVNLIKLGVGTGGGVIVYFALTYFLKVNSFFNKVLDE